MKIEDLDQNKLEQSIANETARLDTCRITLERLKKEYEQKRYEYIHVILGEMEDEILTLESSIDSGENFINECKKALKKFNNI